MMKHLPVFAALLAAATFTACSGGSSTSGSTPSATTPATTAASSTAPPSSAPPSSPPSSQPAARARTAAELKKALLELRDLPSGFAVDTSAGDDDGSASSKDPRCATFIRIMDTDTAPGSKANAARSFTGGQQGPFIDESLDYLGSAKAVAALQASFRSAVRSCRSVTVRFPGEGSSKVSVTEVSAPQIGTGPFAVRLTATGGALDGLEIIMVTTGVDDVVVAMTFVAGTPDDVDGATEAAVGKAKKVLGAKTGT